MPPTIAFHPFRRLRLRPSPTPPLPPSSEEDSDVSSPEHDRPHVIHIAAPKTGHRSGERIVSIPESRGAPEKLPQNTHITVTLHETPHPGHPAPSSNKPLRSGVVSVTPPADDLKPPAKSTLIRRVTSKLTISIPSRSNPHGLRSRPSTRTLPAETAPPPVQGPRSPRATIAVSPMLPNSFVSKQHREAALRERGLLPPRKDFSQQEREADERLGCVPSSVSVTLDGLSEAERFKARWLATNRSSESGDSDSGPSAPPYLQGTSARAQSSSSFASPLETDVLRRSSEGKADPPPMGRPSFCSSLPPLSPTSHLEVLHEEPSELPPITPPPPMSPAKLSIIVSSTLDSLPSPIIVESPISCTFSSHYAGSRESQSQLDHPPVPEKDSIHLSASRRRTSDSGDRGRKIVGPSSSSRGTRSLSNLRRSVTESLRLTSSSGHSTADLHLAAPSPVQAPRTAISPTIHNLASILKETRDIEDVESRRLSELAFLD